MDISLLKKIVKESNSISEVCNKLYNNKFYGNRITIKKYININNISVKHFKRNYKNNFHNKKELYDILSINSSFDTTHLKKRLYKEGLKEKICELCGQGEEWKGKKMSLILDHKNGINNDNRLKNLQIVCPNCNATLDTHCRGKRINKIKQKKEKLPYDYKLSIKQRKVNRPLFNVLIDDINNLGYLSTGRKYGVSDNAIRKWKNFYEKYENKTGS